MPKPAVESSGSGMKLAQATFEALVRRKESQNRLSDPDRLTSSGNVCEFRSLKSGTTGLN